MKPILFALVLLVPPLAQSDDASDFWATMKRADRLSDRKQALQALEAARLQYPGREFETTQEMASVYGELGQYQKSMEIWRAGHEKGLFYGLFPQFDYLKPFLNLPQFQALVDRDRELREQAERAATMRFEMMKPASYSSDRKYPLFLVLHAGNDSIDHARFYWRSQALHESYLVAYIQSARPMSSKSYGWRVNDADMRAGLRKLYNEIVASYPVDTNRVLIGGMSAGAMMSLDVVLHNVLPATGYIVNCPLVPPDFEPAMAERMRQRGVRGVIFTGETDFGRAALEEKLPAFTKAGLKYRFTVVPGIGHEIPDDFPSRLDAALAEVDGSAAGTPPAL
jgi:dienelactone hydrolase